MIKLFVSDIDGCLSEPYDRMDLPAIVQLAEHVRLGATPGGKHPAFSICSGRPFPYVECISQLLGVNTPVLFESGGGLFDPSTAAVSWSPRLTADIRKQIDEVSAWMIRDGIPGTSMIYDYAKRTQAGVIGPIHDEIVALVPRVQQFVADHGFDLLVQPTHLSIDVVPVGITKEIGLQWLSDILDIPLQHMAYIGDSIGDLAALNLVGHSFAPENAMEDVKRSGAKVTAARIEGVLEAMDICIEKNRSGVELSKAKR